MVKDRRLLENTFNELNQNKIRKGVYERLFSCYNICMKQKIKVVDKVSGKTLEKEVEIRNQDHFEVQLRTRARIFRNRKAYNRKKKHKHADEEN